MDGPDGGAASGASGVTLESSDGSGSLDGGFCCGSSGLSLFATETALLLADGLDAPLDPSSCDEGGGLALPAGKGATSIVLWLVVFGAKGFRICPPIPGPAGDAVEVTPEFELPSFMT